MEERDLILTEGCFTFLKTIELKSLSSFIAFTFTFTRVYVVHDNTLDELFLPWRLILGIVHIHDIVVLVNEEGWGDFDHTRYQGWLDQLEVESVTSLVREGRILVIYVELNEVGHIMGGVLLALWDHVGGHVIDFTVPNTRHCILLLGTDLES